MSGNTSTESHGSDLQPEKARTFTEGLRAIAIDYALWTSTHGIGQIGRARNWFCRFFWAAVFLGCFTYCVINVMNLLNRFYSDEKQTNIEIEFGETQFPAVTICSLNPYKMSVAERIPSLHALLSAYKNEDTLSVNSNTEKVPRREKRAAYLGERKCQCWGGVCVKATARHNEDDLTRCMCDLSHDFCVECDVDKLTCPSPAEMYDREQAALNFTFKAETTPIAAKAQAQESLDQIINSLGEEERLRLGFTKTEFLIQCSFDAQGCNVSSEFNYLLDNKYGNCFSFNMNRQFQARRAGALYGLRLIVFSNVVELLPMADSTGARLVLHDAAVHPFPDTFGYNSPSATVTSFSLKKVSNQYLSTSRIPCMEQTPTTYYYAGNYTIEGCLRSCMLRKVAVECNCWNSRMISTNDSKFYPSCDLYSTAAKNCISRVKREIRSKSDETKLERMDCFCPQPCMLITFDATVTTATWESVGDYAAVQCSNDSDCASAFKRSSALIEVYFEQLISQKIYEEDGYPFIALLSDIAGQVGFWIGLSVISMVEFAVFLLNVLWFTCVYQRRPESAPVVVRRSEVARRNSYPQQVQAVWPSRKQGKKF